MVRIIIYVINNLIFIFKKQIQGEHIKTWRPRYFVLKSNGNFLGYNNKPTNNEIPNNTFFVKNCKIIISDKPKLNAFILKCSSNEKESIERVFATSDPKERLI